MSIYETLNAAADLLEKDGWCQEDYANDSGQRCTVGAIYQMPTGNQFSISEALSDAECSEAEDYLTYYLAQTADVAHIPSWNDEPDRTQAEVIETLRAAALTAQVAGAKVTPKAEVTA